MNRTAAEFMSPVPRTSLLILMMVLFGLVPTSRSAGSDDLSLRHMDWPPDVFRSAYRLLVGSEQWRAIDSLEGEARQRYLSLFWKRRDPTPTTSLNEFKKQFTERVDVARTRYSAHAEPEPWDRRGEIYIRFGPPDDLIDSSFDAYYEKWYYFGHNLKFMFTGGAEGHRLSPFVEFSGQVQSLPEYHDQRQRTVGKGVVYEPPAGDINIDMALQWYPFRRNDGDYDVYFASSVLLKSIAKRTHDRANKLSYVTRIMTFDSLLQTSWSDSIHTLRRLDRSHRNEISLSMWRTQLSPGFYVVAAEISDLQSRRRAVSAFDDILVPYETTAELDLSPLVMAAEVRDAGDRSGPFVRHGKEIIPMAGGAFKQREDVAFYHEVYNLHPDSLGMCHYEVVYTVFERDGAHPRVLLHQSYHSVEADTYQSGTIRRGTLEKGTYILEVETTDRVSGSRRTALAELKIH